MTKLVSVTKRETNNISWLMKLALGLAFLPVIWLLTALSLKAFNILTALPTFPVITIVGTEQPTHYLFTTNFSENSLLNSIVFCLIAFFIGFCLFCQLAVGRHSFYQAFADVYFSLRHDLRLLLQINPVPKEKLSKKQEPPTDLSEEKTDTPKKVKWIGIAKSSE